MSVQVQLPRDLEQYLKDQVAAGRYRSIEEGLLDLASVQQAREDARQSVLTAARHDLDSAWNEVVTDRTIDGPAFVDALRTRIVDRNPTG